MTYTEEGALLNAATHRIAMRLLLAIDAGLRSGEARNLRCNHLDFNAATIAVWPTKTRTAPVLRTIPMTDRLKKDLITWCAHLAPDTFINQRAGQPIRRPESTIHTIAQRAGVVFTFHDLRHTFATRIAAVSKNPHVVRVLLGHASTTSTDIYVHRTIEEQRARARQLLQKLESMNEGKSRFTQNLFAAVAKPTATPPLSESVADRSAQPFEQPPPPEAP